MFGGGGDGSLVGGFCLTKDGSGVARVGNGGGDVGNNVSGVIFRLVFCFFVFFFFLSFFEASSMVFPNWKVLT